MKLSIATMIATLAMTACGSTQDQPPAQAPAQQTEVTPPQQSTPPYGPGPEEALPPAAPQGAHGMHGQGMAGMCPLRIEGTVVRSENTPAGVALVFTTSGDVDELRRRVAHMAEMHNQHHTGSGQHTTMRGGAAGQGMMMMHQAEARAENIESGARLSFTPMDAGNRDALRTEVQRHATDMMRSGQCPAAMMGPQGGAGQPGGQPGGQYGGQQYGGQQTGNPPR